MSFKVNTTEKAISTKFVPNCPEKQVNVTKENEDIHYK